MDYAALLNALDKASLFDLWRLNVFIARALDDPHKNEALKTQLYVDQAVRYFDTRQNREISGRIVAVKRTRALIRRDHDKKIWSLPFYMINFQGADTGIHCSRSHPKVHRDSLRVGDSVGYKSRGQREVYGVVLKLNRKTATIRLADGEQWNVSYGLLFYVIDAQENAAQDLLDGRVTTADVCVEEYPAPVDTNLEPE
ncbi:MAG: hypothetical protein HY796_11755 [Elusimicrobia bacterium]|nr:hypothetical protein [Elusimicrobiota bacterium]